MLNFARLRAVVMVLAMVCAGLAALTVTASGAGASPGVRPADGCGFDAGRAAQAQPAQAGDGSFRLQPDSYFTNFNTPLDVPNPGVLGNDTLPEFYSTYVDDYPSHGGLDFFGGFEDGNGGFYYCPDFGFIGTDHFTYEVCNVVDDEVGLAAARDGEDECQDATVSILVGGGAPCVSGFPDVPASNPFCPDVAYLTTFGFAKGYSDGKFHPNASVTRQAAAAVLQRFADSGAPKTCSSAPFPDVPVSSAFCASIAYLVAHKVIAGYSDGNFHPTTVVTREAIASFLYKLANGGKTAPACTRAPFPDVSVSNPFCGAIAWAAAHGIAGGYSDGTFHPTRAVSRGALAHFVHKLGGLGG